MTNQLEALTAAAKKYSKTLNAHRSNPKDAEAVEAWDKASSEFYALIKNNELDIVESLIAALEKSQRANAAQDDHINQQADRIESLETKNAGLGKGLGAAEKRIAELESTLEREREKSRRVMSRNHQLEASQLVVKLPNRLQPGADGPDDWYLHSDPDGEYMKADDVVEALRAAGITVQGDE